MALVNVLTVDEVTGLPKLIQAGDAISPASGGTGIPNNAASTLTISGNFATTLTITGITTVTLPDSGTLYGTKANSITSAQLLSSVSDKTGEGLLVFSTTPTFTTSIISPLVIGGIGAGNNLTLQSTSHATKGKILLGTSAYDEVNNYLGIGQATPTNPLEVVGNNASLGMGTFYDAGTTGRAATYLKNNLSKAATCAMYGGSFVGTQLGVAIANSFQIININGDTMAVGTANATPLILGTNNTERARFISTGQLGLGVTTPTSILHLKAGTAIANTAPLQFTSGVSETVARAGVVEFTTDDLFFTITTGAARKGFVFNDGTKLTSGRIPFVTTNGRLTDDVDFTFATDTLTVTKIAATTITGNMTFEDGKNIVFKTTTGTKIGTATNQKIGFWNAAPVIQETGIIDADGTLADITTKFNSLLSKLETVGLLAVA